MHHYIYNLQGKKKKENKRHTVNTGGIHFISSNSTQADQKDEEGRRSKHVIFKKVQGTAHHTIFRAF